MTRKRLVSTIAIIVMMIAGGAALLILPLNTDWMPLVFAQNEPASGQPQQGDVTERAVPMPGIPPTMQLPGQMPGQQPPKAGPLTEMGPVQPPVPSGTGGPIVGLGPGIDAANALLALPWRGLSKQREEDAERSIRASLEGKRIAHGGANWTLKGSSLAKWDFSLKVTNVGANLDFAAPPGFRTASLNGFIMEAPLGRSW